MVKKLRAWLEKVYVRRITQEFDNPVLIIGDEGVGKSNLIIGLVWWWKQIRGIDPDTENVLNQLVWDRSGFEEAMADFPKQSAIAVNDAARILHKKKAMHPDQIDTETDLFDVRTKEHLMLLGFQDWKSVATSLQERRARHALYVPARGHVWGYSRETLDERVGEDEWPEPDLRDTFPALETVDAIADTWEAFQELDLQKKQERIRNDDEDEESSWEPKDVIDDILADDPGEYVKQNEYNGSVHINKDLLQLDYGLSIRDAKTVAAGIEREVDITQFVDDADAADRSPEGEGNTV